MLHMVQYKGATYFEEKPNQNKKKPENILQKAISLIPTKREEDSADSHQNVQKEA